MSASGFGMHMPLPLFVLPCSRPFKEWRAPPCLLHSASSPPKLGMHNFAAEAPKNAKKCAPNSAEKSVLQQSKTTQISKNCRQALGQELFYRQHKCGCMLDRPCFRAERSIADCLWSCCFWPNQRLKHLPWFGHLVLVICSCPKSDI